MDNKRLGTEKISRLLLIFAVPSVISMVLNAIYNMVDQIFIGQGVGYLANGATNVIFPLTQFAVAIGLLLGDGAASFINLKMGANDKKAADKGLAAGVAGLLISGIIIAIIYNIFLEPFCHLFGATDATLPYALDYGRIISIGIVFCVFGSGCLSIIRADGAPQLAMIGMVTGCIINIIGDPLCIFVFHMGVKGAAWATIAGQAANMIIYLVYLFGLRKEKLNLSFFRGFWKYIPRVSKLGISSFTTQLCIVLVIAVQNNLLVYYGAQSEYGPEIPMTALGVTMKVFTVLQFAISGLMAGAQPIISYNYGSNRFGRVKQTLLITLIISMSLMAIATVWFQVAPMSIIQIFGSESELYNDFSVKCLKIFLALLVVDSIQMVASSFLQSVGKSGIAAMLVLLRQVFVSIPVMLLLTHFFGVMGVLYSGPVAGLVVGTVSAICLVKEWKELTAKENDPAYPVAELA